MALYNKDGSVYTLSGPNPAMKEQDIWGDFVLHNMKWNSEKYKDTMDLKPVKSDIKVKESFLQELEKTKPEKTKVVGKVIENSVEQNSTIEEKVSQVYETPQQAPQESIEETKIYERKVEVHQDKQRIEEETKPEFEKTFIHCLPATIRVKKDDLYGDVFKTVQYGSPTSFEGIVLVQEDLFVKIWTDAFQIDKGSILYPKANFKRWWKVNEVESKAKGWILTCMPSDYQPSFTD
jgi:hypothetical protein